eukprot:Tbor_TRINITY_DN5429_c3_g1::TRINITY_DN5429_c3_g1_i1::g.24679::m.24679
MTESGSTDFVIVNGEQMPLMADGRFPVYHHFPIGTTLYDPSAFPPSRVPLCGVGQLGSAFESPLVNGSSSVPYGRTSPCDESRNGDNNNVCTIPLSTSDERGVTVFRLIPHCCYFALTEEVDDAAGGVTIMADIPNNNNSNNNSSTTTAVKCRNYRLATAPPLDGDIISSNNNGYFDIYKDMVSHNLAPTLNRIHALQEEVSASTSQMGAGGTSIINPNRKTKGVTMMMMDSMNNVPISRGALVDTESTVTSYILVHWIPFGMWESVWDFLFNVYFKDTNHHGDHHGRHHYHNRNNNNNHVVVADDTRVSSKGIACLLVKSYETRLKALKERYLLCSVNINNNVVMGAGNGSFYLYFEGTDWKPSISDNATPYVMGNTPGTHTQGVRGMPHIRGYPIHHDHANINQGPQEHYNSAQYSNATYQPSYSNARGHIHGRGGYQQRQGGRYGVPQGRAGGTHWMTRENVNSVDSNVTNYHGRIGASSSNSSIIDGLGNSGSEKRLSSFGAVVSSNGNNSSNNNTGHHHHHSTKQPVAYFVAKIPSDADTSLEEWYFTPVPSKLSNYKNAIKMFDYNIIVLFIYSDIKLTTLFGHGHVIGLENNSVKVRWGSKRVDKEVYKIVKESFAVQLEQHDSVMFTDSLGRPHLMGDCNELLKQLVSGNWDVRSEKANGVCNKGGANAGSAKGHPLKTIDADQNNGFINAVKGITSSGNRQESLKSSKADVQK